MNALLPGGPSLGTDGTGTISLTNAALPKTELCRVSTPVPRSWSVSIGRVSIPNTGPTLFPRATAHVEWGHGRANFATRVDVGQSFLVHGSFVRLSIESPGGLGGVRGTISGQIVPSFGGGTTEATLTEFLEFPGGIIGTFQIPAFARWVQDTAYRELPTPAGPYELPSREFTWEGAGGAFGQTFILDNMSQKIGVPQGAGRMFIELKNASNPGGQYQTALTWWIALS